MVHVYHLDKVYLDIGSLQHHMRTIKINTQTGDYYMKGTQDNWMWYRNITATGCCRVINPR